MNHKIDDKLGTLTIYVNAEERKFLDDVGNISSDAPMYDFFEHLTCNSELEWIDPSLTGDLTSAPMLGIFGEERVFTKEDATIPHRVTGPDMIQEVEARWAFMDYAVRSVLEELRDKGQCVFVGGKL